MRIAVLNSSNEELERYISPFALLLHDGVESGASLGYLYGTTVEKYEDFWESELRDVAQGKGKIIFAEVDREIVGVVQLAYGLKQTAQHRAEVRKLIVRSDHRGRGIAKKLMETLELEARISGKTLLYLDTETDSDADFLYPELEWNLLGILPKYAASPDGELEDCSFYWKDIS